jgi:hypothetical protein
LEKNNFGDGIDLALRALTCAARLRAETPRTLRAGVLNGNIGHEGPITLRFVVRAFSWNLVPQEKRKTANIQYPTLNTQS